MSSDFGALKLAGLACVAGIGGYLLGSVNSSTPVATPISQSKKQVSEQGKVRFTYWHGFGRGEGIRSCLAGAGVDFEDIGLSGPEDFAKLQPKLRWGQVPLLEIDGKNLVQSGSCVRYVARMYDLYGNDASDKYEIDTLVDAINDFYNAVIGYPFKDETGQEAIRLLINEKLHNKYLSVWEECLQNKTYFVGECLSVADLVFFAHMRMVMQFMEFDWFVNKYSNLSALYLRIQKLPQMDRYLKKEEKEKLKLPFDEYKNVVKATLQF